MITRATAMWSRIRRWMSPTEWFVYWFRLPTSKSAAQERGLVLIQIDGLSRYELDRAMKEGRMPFLRSLLDREHYTCRDLYSGLPSSTPSVQGELFYGTRCAVPAFGFRDHRSGEVVRMFAREIAADVEQRLAKNESGVLSGGSTYCNVYGGGAQETHFCASSLGWSELMKSVNSWKLMTLLFWHLWSVARMLGLVTIEFVLALGGFIRGTLSGREYWQELLMIPARVVVVILLRELTIMGVTMDVTRGVPIVQLNLLGYDEQAHRRGPESRFAHWTLIGIDRATKRLWRAAHFLGRREYDVWIYSDHGQIRTTPYEYVAGKRLAESANEVVDRIRSEPTRLNVNGKTTITSRAGWLGTSRLVGMLFGEDFVENEVPFQGVQVAALGPLGLIYINRKSTNEHRLAIGEQLVRDHEIPIAFVRHGSTVIGINKSGQYDLQVEPACVFGSDHPFLKDIVSDMIRLCHHPDAGDVVVSGWVRDGNSLSFATQNGAHAGPSPEETNAFAMVPSDIQFVTEEKPYIRPNDLRLAIKRFIRTGASTVSNDKWIGPARHIRVMTYNVHACIGMDHQLSTSRIARVIAQSRADIIALQELDVYRARSGYQDQAQEIARLLEMECHFHPAWCLEEESYGDAILSRFPMRLVRKGALPSSRPRRERRGALWTEVETDDGIRLQVINTHLSIYPGERDLQAACLAKDWVRPAKELGTTVVCGDFNAQPRSQTYQHLSQLARDVQCYSSRGKADPTFFSPRPLARIDHVFVTDDIIVERARVLESRLARVASDHLPLVADLVAPQFAGADRPLLRLT